MIGILVTRLTAAAGGFARLMAGAAFGARMAATKRIPELAVVEGFARFDEMPVLGRMAPVAFSPVGWGIRVVGASRRMAARLTLREFAMGWLMTCGAGQTI